ncbi:hypothetical protein Lesp02_03120 [Lentzea sp. NBRC 105346]|uniref:hypothetical protein n=1 Tax=Lentzea sp. NBRC 105346 TaxID=3032205 RepID=UPI0024A46322|nr:hypothetical protein [Lentzea sp. NBRC 105346]GLZ28122.1 hypothetical protein Lesp02_03120 [Lentzea sp. NBRC 105346]
MTSIDNGADKALDEKNTDPRGIDGSDTTTADPADGVIKTIFANDGYELLVMDPHALYLGEGIESNTRQNVVHDPVFWQDIKDNGVEDVIDARRDKDGRVRVHDGKMRTLAARDGGVPAVLVLIKPNYVGSERDAEVSRIFSQLRLNEYRNDIPHADKMAALQQLVLLDVSAEDIAQQRHIDVKEAKKIVTTVKSAAAVESAKYDLTIDEMALIAEFDGDDAATDALMHTAASDRYNLRYKAAELRRERADAAMLEPVLARLTTSNTKVVTDDDVTLDDNIKPLDALRPSAGHEPGTELTMAAHKKCPGHAALVSLKGHGKDRKVATTYVCTNYQMFGHAHRNTPKGVVAPKTEGKLNPEQLADRRLTIKNNKLWDAHVDPRREWMADFFRNGSLPKGLKVQRRIAQLQLAAGYDFNRARERSHPLLCEMLGITLRPGPYGPQQGDTAALQKIVDRTSEKRAGMINLAIWMCAIEAGMNKHTWKNRCNEARLMMTVLEELGKPLSEIELYVLGRDTDGKPFDTNADSDPEPASIAQPDGTTHTDDAASAEDVDVDVDLDNSETTIDRDADVAAHHDDAADAFAA